MKALFQLLPLLTLVVLPASVGATELLAQQYPSRVPNQLQMRPNRQCPKGQIQVPFEQPIYDSDGLFVIGYETVYYCVPADLEPAG